MESILQTNIYQRLNAVRSKQPNTATRLIPTLYMTQVSDWLIYDNNVQQNTMQLKIKKKKNNLHVKLISTEEQTAAYNGAYCS